MLLTVNKGSAGHTQFSVFTHHLVVCTKLGEVLSKLKPTPICWTTNQRRCGARQTGVQKLHLLSLLASCSRLSHSS